MKKNRRVQSLKGTLKEVLLLLIIIHKIIINNEAIVFSFTVENCFKYLAIRCKIRKTIGGIARKGSSTYRG